MLRVVGQVSMVQIQHIPLIKIRHEDTQRGSDVSEKVRSRSAIDAVEIID